MHDSVYYYCQCMFSETEEILIFRKNIRGLLCGILLLLLVTLSAMASAEYGRVKTPGGPVKMRKTESSKGKLVCEIPNNTIIEADEIGEEWCHVIYNGKSGYVMTKFLRLSSLNDGTAPRILLDRETIGIGDPVRITVENPEAVECRFMVTEGNKVIKGKRNAHTETCYRPRKAGLHSLEVTLWDAEGNERTGEIFFEVEDKEAPQTEKDFTLYSQRDGWWSDKRYSVSNLSDSGCAIFTLSHALQWLGYEGESLRPENLAVKYAFCLVDGGTLNQTLIGRTARDYGYKTQDKLITKKNVIIEKFNDGAVFTFAIVKGHIAMAAEVSEDGEKIMIIDSAPSCTMERIKGGNMYLRNEEGEYTVITDLNDVPGLDYYFETDQYGGLIYYLDTDYVAKRGVRLIQPIIKEK